MLAPWSTSRPAGFAQASTTGLDPATVDFARIRSGMRRRHAARLGCIPVYLLLCGCGGPSGDDIKSALQDAISQYGAVAASMLKIEDVSNVSCREPGGKSGYLCTYTLVAINPMTKAKESHVVEKRFVQTGSKWAIVEGN
jgi:hypothetical protein